MGTILDEIVRTKKAEVEQARLARPLAEVERAATSAAPPRDFLAALTRTKGDVCLIAEIKKSSPSAGLIREDFEPVAIARTYERCGAAALSVLTDRTYFSGELAFIEQVKRAVALPVLRKDFIIDEYQVLESRAAGADALLLIAAILSPRQIDAFSRRAADLGMALLIEVHNQSELEAVRSFIHCDRRTILGINNRDLHRQRVDLETTVTLAQMLPPGTPFVAESGIKSRADVQRVAGAGAAAVLIGETFVRATDIEAEVRTVMGWR